MDPVEKSARAAFVVVTLAVIVTFGVAAVGMFRGAAPDTRFVPLWVLWLFLVTAVVWLNRSRRK